MSIAEWAFLAVAGVAFVAVEYNLILAVFDKGWWFDDPAP